MFTRGYHHFTVLEPLSKPRRSGLSASRGSRVHSRLEVALIQTSGWLSSPLEVIYIYIYSHINIYNYIYTVYIYYYIYKHCGLNRISFVQPFGCRREKTLRIFGVEMFGMPNMIQSKYHRNNDVSISKTCVKPSRLDIFSSINRRIWRRQENGEKR